MGGIKQNGGESVPWETRITEIKENEIRIHGYPLDGLMGRRSFSDMVFLMLKGELPSANEGRMLDIMLVSCIDHGVTPPSTLAALTAASTGAPYNGALAAGILSINEYHGGAIENSMRMLMEMKEVMKREGGTDIRGAADVILKRYKDTGKKLPGFGHRIHKKDPRTVRLMKFAEELGLNGEWIALLKGLEETFASTHGRKLPVNVDGAIAALLLEMEIAPEFANLFFIMARVPGLAAHIHEERTMQKPMRRIDPVNHKYTGKLPRKIPEFD